MLIEFKVSNYRSIGDEQILSLLPSSKFKDYPNNILGDGAYQGLNAIALYGANASGKSNILKAIELLDRLLYTSSKNNSTDKLPYSPFLLKKGYDNQPTKLEITFIINNTRYRFGVEYNKDQILTEYLFRKKVSREVSLFFRQGDTIDVSSAFNDSKLPKLIDTAIEATKENSLFLSTCDMFNIEEAKSIFEWFDRLIYVDGLSTHREGMATIQLWENKDFRQKIKDYLSSLDLGFYDLEIQTKEFDMNDLPSSLDDNFRATIAEQLKGKKGFKPMVSHYTYNEKNEKTEKTHSWLLGENESQGTQKAFHLSGPLLRTLTEGGILVIDEIEAKMHPVMTINTINLFLNKATNPKDAQIIFATHDTNLLTYSKLRRDQITFVEKNKWESTEIYTLSDFKYFQEKTGNKTSERIDSDKEKRYLEGRYGAIPMLGNPLQIISIHNHGEER